MGSTKIFYKLGNLIVPIFCGYLSLPYLALLFGCCMIFLMNLSNSLYLFVQRIFWHPCILQLPSHCSIPHCMERCCHSHHLLYRFPILMDTVSIQMDDQNRKILEIQMLSSIAALAKKGNDKAILNFIAIPETLPVRFCGTFHLLCQRLGKCHKSL